MRFTIDVLTEIRRRVGPDFLVGLRLVADEQAEGGIDKEEGIRIATYFRDSGLIDFLNIVRGRVFTGLSKLAAPAATIGYIQSVGLPLPQVGLAIALVVELLGGVALILGYRTRLVASVLAVFAIATALAFHSALGDQNQFIHFFKNVAIAGGLLNVIALGGGAWSLDARR